MQYKEMEGLIWNCPNCLNNQDTASNDLLNQLRHTNQNNLKISMGNEEENQFGDFKAKVGNDGIKLGHININGLISKLSQVQLLLKETQIDILAITCKRKTATMILIFEPRMIHIVQVFSI